MAYFPCHAFSWYKAQKRSHIGSKLCCVSRSRKEDGSKGRCFIALVVSIPWVGRGIPQSAGDIGLIHPVRVLDCSSTGWKTSIYLFIVARGVLTRRVFRSQGVNSARVRLFTCVRLQKEEEKLGADPLFRLNLSSLERWVMQWLDFASKARQCS